MSKYFKVLNSISLADKEVFGGKTSSLGEMVRAGLPVPGGFGVSVQTQIDHSDKPFTYEMTREIDRLFKEQKLKRVAVRSSAIAEDSKDASWAGQLESYLNVTRDGVEEAIRKCWESITTEHARAYARSKSIKGGDALVGVTVQSMIDSEVAGVMLTANPISGNRDEMVVESVYGLGETLVQGLVTPDRFIFDKQNQRVTDFDIGIKQKMMFYESGENKITDLPLTKGDRATLREPEVIELATVGQNVEKHNKDPQDIEWAYSNNKFYVIQSRPITTS